MMLFALLLAVLVGSRGGCVEVWLSVLFFGVLSIIDFCAIPLERRRLARKERERLEAAQLRLERLACVEKRLLAGELVRLEEWWEDDDLWIDENAHIHLVFSDGEEMDFVLYQDIAPEISRLLATQGICWEASFRLTAGSRVIWQKG